jgi:transcriptional regulator with XRE-family HTH domain
MNIGTKIKTLRDARKMSQPELAHKLGIAQATLSNIESGDTKKVDFLLMDKVCKEFEVSFDYFVDDKQVNNVDKNEGTIAYSVGTINNLSEKLIDQYELRLQEKDEIIEYLKKVR